mmetsp:Transcript_19291/g.53006  ORF Transcript_19291/g.53006 Transcript_19291/m.53006 type:complete len:180 (+) Transcript_19291:110-649(+)
MAIPTDPISLLGEWFRLQYERARRYASTFQGWDGIAWAKGLAHRTTPDAILLLWLVVGVAGAITLPLVAFTGARAANEADFDYDQWVARQQANQQAYNQNNNGKDWYNWKSSNGKYDDFDSYNEYNSYGYNQQQQQQYNYYGVTIDDNGSAATVGDPFGAFETQSSTTTTQTVATGEQE